MSAMHTPTNRGRATALGLVAMLVGLAMTFVGIGAAGAQEPEPEPTDISVVFTPADVQGPCVPTGFGLTYVVHSDDDVFRLTVTAASPQCSPIEAHAVIYAMPGNGEAWPQELVEKAPVTISEAGVYEITFSKECDPVQFDVVTGATPQTITPLGEFHGPMLFPFDINTAQQYWGDAADCPPPSTTTTTSTTASTTTTSTPEVLPTTIVPPPEVDGVTTIAPNPGNTEVAGTSTTRQPAALALTGTSASLGIFGAALLVAGMALIVIQRRRTA